MTKAMKSAATSREKIAALLASKPTISPEELYGTGAFGGRNTVYDACGNGQIECFRLGKRIFIPTAPLRRKLGIEAESI